MTTRAAALAVLGVMVASVAGCRRDGCVGGDDGTCLPPGACQALRYTCDAPESSLRMGPIVDDAAADQAISLTAKSPRGRPLDAS